MYQIITPLAKNYLLKKNLFKDISLLPKYIKKRRIRLSDVKNFFNLNKEVSELNINIGEDILCKVIDTGFGKTNNIDFIETIKNLLTKNNLNVTFKDFSNFGEISNRGVIILNPYDIFSFNKNELINFKKILSQNAIDFNELEKENLFLIYHKSTNETLANILQNFNKTKNYFI